MVRRSVLAVLAAVTLLMAITVGTALGAKPVFVFHTQMTGENEVPGPGDPDAIGSATVRVYPETNKICWAVTWARVDGTVSAAHIHGRAEADEAVGPLVTFFGGTSFAGQGSNRGCTTHAAADDIILVPELYYVNVHSSPDFGPGAIRGQLG